VLVATTLDTVVVVPVATVMVLVAYTVARGADKVTVRAVTPMQEHAEEYLTAPEHGEAYAGMRVGMAVCLLRNGSTLVKMVVVVVTEMTSV
jgi:hypothetical protein